jgi:hypothetical protein
VSLERYDHGYPYQEPSPTLLVGSSSRRCGMHGVGVAIVVVVFAADSTSPARVERAVGWLES